MGRATDTFGKRKLQIGLLVSCLVVFVILSILYESQLIQKILNPFPLFVNHLRSGKFTPRNLLENEESENNFLVKTIGCDIYSPNPFDESVRPFLGNSTAKTQICTDPFVSSKNGKLQINRKFVKSKSRRNILNCCYREISRVTQDLNNYTKDADSLIELSNCKQIPQNGSSTSISSEFIQIECRKNQKENATFDFIGTIFSPQEHSPITRQKFEYWTQQQSFKSKLKPQFKSNLPPSVLIVGIDSTSRLHFIRSLPKTRAFLMGNDFIELKGYTKIGDNTFPNIMGLLGGIQTESDYELVNQFPNCWPTNSTIKIDECPLIWKEFSNRRYITAHIEDSPFIASFNYVKVGFVKQPVDYYLRPLGVAYEKKLGTSTSICLQGQSQTDFALKYIDNFVGKMDKNIPYFLTSWLTSASHDDFQGIKKIDSKFQKFLKNVLDTNGGNTLIIFLSDHGYRFGPFRETFLGYYEESLPFFFVRIPPNLKTAFPEWYKNLKTNSARLTSPFDVHRTLQEILPLVDSMAVPHGEKFKLKDFSTKTAEPSLEGPGAGPGLSLFQPIPSTRTCDSASIPSSYCRCDLRPNQGIQDDLVSRFGKLLVDKINSYRYKEIQVAINCVVLKLNKILYNRKLREGEGFGQVKFADYLMGIETAPSDARFEGHLRLFEDNSIFVLDKILRINRYADQSRCISSPFLKAFCVCKNYLV